MQINVNDSLTAQALSYLKKYLWSRDEKKMYDTVRPRKVRPAREPCATLYSSLIL